MSLETEERGFAIRKDVSEKDGQHVQLDLDIASTHASEAIVTVEESVPPGTDHSQIGFLPDHEPVEWDLADDGTLLLSARLEPEGSRRIIYGLRDIEPSEADPLGNEPRVVEVGGPAAEEAAEGEEQSAAEAAAAAAEEGDGGQGGTLETPLDDETARALAEAIEPHLEVDSDGGPDTDPVTETKVSQLQEDVADMRAYLPAFEEFLGETGRADDILTELENIKSRLDELEDGPDDLVETVEDVDDRLATLEERVAGIDAWRAAVADAAQSPAQAGDAADGGDGEGDEADAGEGESEADAEAEGEVDDETDEAGEDESSSAEAEEDEATAEDE